jgi:hypothetical protein
VRKRVKFGDYFFDRATNSGSAVVKKMSDNLTLVHRSKIKWNLAIGTEFPLQYIKQHDFSLKNEPPFCLHFLMNNHLCIKPLVTIADAKCPTFLVMF